ncbi:hypothetical protein BS47DRAFT_1350972 [Hydnum rufescens UP504]|uniref:Uncharacterized protein n=1 Tax=Hydnum rufescens UP504 TaxID=1448309 RepID=A0A9P6DNG8_9AGAM|nr:hypothetical protein BS47DRAFT_1350972 [Hydnum rufescens UP504]
MANMNRESLGDGNFKECRRRADDDNAGYDLRSISSQKKVHKLAKPLAFSARGSPAAPRPALFSPKAATVSATS